MNGSKPRLLISALLVLASVVGGCGGGPPMVATVAGQGISEATYQHWLTVVERTSLSSVRNAGQRTQIARIEALQFLLRAQWVLGESEQRGIAVPESSIDAQVARLEAASGRARYDRALSRDAMTTQDVLFQLRNNALEQRLQAVEGAGSAPITAQRIAGYYQQHTSEFRWPVRRGIAVIFTKNLSSIQAARRALDSGDSFAAVAKRYSTSFTRDDGDRLIILSRVELDPQLGNPVFSAPLGLIEGPVHGRLGYYIFRVGKILPAGPMSPAERRPLIVHLLKSEQSSLASQGFSQRLARRWIPQTRCRPGFVVYGCREYRKHTSS